MNGPHTAVACRLGTCTRPGRPTCHVHDRPCTRPGTRPVYTNIYRAMYGPCPWPVYTAVYWPCTRPCIWRVHGLVTAVYTYACVHGCVHGVNGPCTWPRTSCVGPCRRPCTCRVQGRGPCTRLVRSVLLRFSLQMTPFMPKRTATNPLHSELEMWVNAQRDGSPVEYRWRPLFNAAVWLMPTTRVPCSNAAKTRNASKFAGMPKLANRSQPLVGRSSPYCKDMWGTCCHVLSQALYKLDGHFTF